MKMINMIRIKFLDKLRKIINFLAAYSIIPYKWGYKFDYYVLTEKLNHNMIRK